MQAAFTACIIIRGLTSIIEFQRQLYVPWGLSACDLSDRRPQTGVGRVVLDMVKGVDEVATKLQTDAFRQLEVFVQARVDIEVARRAQTSQLRCAIPERAGRRAAEVLVIGVTKPLTSYSRYEGVRDRGETVAVCARSATEGVGIIRRSSNRHWPARAPSNDRAHFPASNDPIDGFAGVLG
jgi:hypothetical protein